MNHSQVDVIVVSKKSVFQRYSEGTLAAPLEEMLDDADEFSSLRYAHDEHEMCKNDVFSYLKSRSLRYIVYSLDDLKSGEFSYFIPGEGARSSFLPKTHVVLSLGGDGTLLHASHFLGGETILAGINTCPKHSVGHLCALRPEKLKKQLDGVFSSSLPCKKVARLSASISTSAGQTQSLLPLALNDILICHRHPAAASRYYLTVKDSCDGKVVRHEKQVSSGIWSSTAAGMTAGISTYGFSAHDWSSPKMFVACREPYENIKNSLQLKRFDINGDAFRLEFHSRMRQGIVCVDGQDFCGDFSFNDTVSLSVPSLGYLNLVV